MSSIYKPVTGGGGGVPITEILGDTGNITGSIVTIFANNVTQNSGSSVAFNNSGTVSTFNVTDARNNTIIGKGAGNATLTGTDNVALGREALLLLTSGTDNTAIGFESGLKITTGSNNTAIGLSSLGQLTTGSNNISIGQSASSSYTSSETGNITIGAPGLAGESHVLRIGINGSSPTEQNKCFVAGITGATPTSANTPQVVLCDNAGNLAPISSSTSGFVLTSNGAATPSFQAAAGGSSTVLSVALTSSTANLTSGVLSTVVYDTVLIDTASGYSAGLYTVPTTGNWLITTTGLFLTSVSFTGCDTFINKNSGTFLLHMVGLNNLDGVTVSTNNGSAIFPLTGGDTINISVFGITAGGGTYTGFAAGNGFYNTFTMTLL